MTAQRTRQPNTFLILVVCTANVCRSPLAEHLFRDVLDESSAIPLPRFEIRSAGTHGWDGSEMDPDAAAELQLRGGDSRGFRARSIADADCEDADLILTATTEHRAYVLQAVPTALRRTFTLLEFAHLVSTVESVRRAYGSPSALVKEAADARGAAELDDYDLPDPYGASSEVHHQVADTVFEVVTAVAPALTGRPFVREPVAERPEAG